MKEYRVKKGLRISIYILASLVLLLYAVMTILVVSPSNEFANSDEEKLLLPPLFIFMIVLMIVGIIAIAKRKVVITDEAITQIGFFRKRELKLAEIKGVSIGRNPKIPFLEHIVIEPIDRKKKSIVFSNMIEDCSGIKSVLTSRLTDLEREKREAVEKIIEDEKQEILANEEFGVSSEEREEKLKKARLTSYILNGIGVFVCLWIVFFPRPYKYAVIACIALPLITLLAIKFWKGLIRVDGAKNSVYPNVIYALIAPGMALSYGVMLDFSIEDYSNVWIPTVIIAIVFTAVLLLFSKYLSFKKGKDLFTILSFVVFTFAYGFGTVLSTNCLFDKSVPKMFVTEVVNKEINEGKVTRYYLYLSPWGKKAEIEKVSIDSDMYRHLNNGDEVSIYQFKGKFDIPWIVVGYAR